MELFNRSIWVMQQARNSGHDHEAQTKEWGHGPLVKHKGIWLTPISSLTVVICFPRQNELYPPILETIRYRSRGVCDQGNHELIFELLTQRRVKLNGAGTQN